MPPFLHTIAMNKILIVTNDIDPHTDVVVSKLKSPIFRLDINDLVSGQCEFIVDRNQVLLRSRDALISLSDVGVVFWRKPLIEPKYLPDNDEALYNQWAFTLENIAAILAHVSWLNHPAMFWRASKKLYQLVLAHNLGLKVPESIFSTRPASCFNSINGNNILFKSIVTQHSLQGTFLEKSFGNILLGRDDISESDVVPSLLQSYINKVAEWRITVVGDNIFPGRITTSESYIDIKEVHKTRVSQVPIRREIKYKLLEFMKQTSLEYCAFDFLEDENGELWFLEANPNGQWLWIEASTEQNISGAIAELLDSKQSNNAIQGANFPLCFTPLKINP